MSQMSRQMHVGQDNKSPLGTKTWYDMVLRGLSVLAALSFDDFHELCTELFLKLNVSRDVKDT